MSFNIKLIFLILIICITSVLIYLELLSANPRISEVLNGSHHWITAVATLLIAIATFVSISAQNKMVEVSVSMKEISKRAADQDETRLKAELRPYLVIQLNPDPNEFKTTEYLKRDGNSRFYWPSLYENKFLILPFKIKNVGKIPAVNIRAKYDSPAKSNEWFKIGENGIAPDMETSEIFRPWINISSVIANTKIQEFDVGLKITYKGNDEIDSKTYVSLLNLIVIKKGEDYEIKDSNFKFYSE